MTTPLPGEPPPVTFELATAAISAYGGGKSIASIAADLGVAYVTIQRLLVAHNVPRRPKGGNQRKPRPGAPASS